MSRSGRVLGTVALACALVPLVGVPSASAATTSETASTGAYYLRTNPGTVTVPVVGSQRLPDNARNADGVAEDDLAVAVTATDGNPDKFSALSFDLVDLVPGTIVSKAVLSVALSDNPASRRTPNASPDLVVACAVGSEGFSDADGEPFIDAPSVKCKDFTAKATASKDGKAYEFDITALAQKMVESNDGLALYPSETGLKTPFQQVFKPKTDARLTVAFVAPPGTILTEPPAPVDTSTGDSGQVSVGSDFIPATPGTPGTSGTPGVPVTVAQPQPQPQVQAQPQPKAFVPAAATKPPMRLDGATWAALLGGALLLLLASLALGAPPPASGGGSSARRGGVGEQLARRQRAGGPAPSRLRVSSA